jgi:hypothetical protein
MEPETELLCEDQYGDITLHTSATTLEGVDIQTYLLRMEFSCAANDFDKITDEGLVQMAEAGMAEYLEKRGYDVLEPLTRTPYLLTEGKWWEKNGETP